MRFLRIDALARLVAAVASVLLGAPFARAERPNIVFILIDDMRADAMGWAGHPFLETPNLDRLAREGVAFENCFVTTSLCSPSRASILSGQYAHLHRVLDNSTPLPADTPIFPVELQRAGYETGFFGKWHMGGESDAPRPGFDRWVSFRGQGVYKNPALNIDGARTPTEGYVTDLITDHAEEFLRKKREKPFFAYVSHKAVHAEFAPAERHKGSYSGKSYPHPESMADTEENYRGKPAWVRAQRKSWHGVDGMYNKTTDFGKFAVDYAETMRAVDDSVGRILEALRASGELERTLLLFTSDNGFMFGEHGLIDKRAMYEPSIRVPLLARGPGMAAGTRRKEMILNIDFAPTILEAAGAPIPATMQGRSFLNLLGGGAGPWRDAFLYEYFWEKSFPQTPTVFGVRTDRYKLMKFHGVWDRYELYDLQEDPGEQNNLIGDYLLEAEAGNNEPVIRRKAPDELKKLFNGLDRRLAELIKEAGASEVPAWGAALD